MSAKQAYRLRTQAETRKTAIHDGEKYTSKEDAIIIAGINAGKTDKHIAIQLGRTAEAIGRYRDRFDLKKIKNQAKKLPPTRFFYHAESGIPSITVEHFDDVISVFCPKGTTDAAIEAAFTVKGVGEYYQQWQQEKVNV